MPDKVKELRDSAAREFAAARHAKSSNDQTKHKRLAKAFKSLSESQAWLDGRPKNGRRTKDK